jgi:hypothetical protein
MMPPLLFEQQNYKLVISEFECSSPGSQRAILKGLQTLAELFKNESNVLSCFIAQVERESAIHILLFECYRSHDSYLSGMEASKQLRYVDSMETR